MVSVVTACPKALVVVAVVVIAGGALTAAWVLVPLLGDTRYSTQSEFYKGTIFNDSYGAGKILGWLFGGSLFDEGRFPIISLLVAVGFVVCCMRARRDERHERTGAIASRDARVASALGEIGVRLRGESDVPALRSNLGEQELDGLGHLTVVGHVLEHVLGRELELLLGLLVEDARVHLLVVVGAALLVGGRHADHRVDDADLGPGGLERFAAHDPSVNLNTRSAFSRRNFGQTWSRKPTSGISAKMRSSDRPIG